MKHFSFGFSLDFRSFSSKFKSISLFLQIIYGCKVFLKSIGTITFKVVAGLCTSKFRLIVARRTEADSAGILLGILYNSTILRITFLRLVPFSIIEGRVLKSEQAWA